MQQVATYEAVVAAIHKLNEDEQKITADNILRITGGAKGTVLQHLRAYREQGAAPAIPTEIPEDFQGAVMRLIGQAQAEARRELEDRMLQALASEMDALDALVAAESRIEALSSELATAQAQADADRQAAKEAAAGTAKQIEGLEKNIEGLRIERKQLIEAGEAARTEAAKAQLQVERADAAAQKAETQLADLRDKLPAAEKAAAVAEQHARDLEAALAKSEARTQDLEGRLDEMRRINSELEKSLAAAQAPKKTEPKARPAAKKKEKSQ
jgi:DNA-binding transcriptional ArsR family regulator